jgi:hypothetical protein
MVKITRDDPKANDAFRIYLVDWACTGGRRANGR